MSEHPAHRSSGAAVSEKPLSSIGAVSLVGGASILNVAFGLLKMKVAAMVLGPAGVGIIGLFQQLMTTFSVVFALGMTQSGTRHIAEAHTIRSNTEQAAVRRALFWGTVALAGIGGGLFFILRNPLAHHVMDDPLRAGEVGWRWALHSASERARRWRF